MIPADKNGKPILPRADVVMRGKVQRVSREGVFVEIAPGRVEYVSPDSLEVVPDA